MLKVKALAVISLITLISGKSAFQVSRSRTAKVVRLQQMSKDLDDERVRAEVDKAIVTPKGNYSPIMVRLAWHSSGTYDKDDKSSRHGGSDGATMRFEPESSDPANAGLTIPQEVLKPIKNLFPNLSYGELVLITIFFSSVLCKG